MRRWAGERLGRAECVGSGPLGEGREEWAERGWAWAAVGFGFGFVFYFSLSNSYSFLFLIQTSLNSKTNLNSNHTQLKVCTSMNASTKFKPTINFNYLRNKNLG